ncbi:MAG TPA: uroporphyrinogen decarboxylase family protein [Candidatus Methylomirabilis sp.]|nr:uroporphyrinogen decarboxylase family protein [Candidatus Methylomirabilis sp.]HSC70891.1 uroporphyrinogen decarboxylase family protein [Candidatus Methylomirabilis sp.]
MNKAERVRAAIAGKPVDRPPFTIWYHFGNQHAAPERTAQVHLEFFEYYDLDLLKMMNDYDYPMPEGMDVMATPGDLQRMSAFDVTRTPLGQQLKAVELVAKALQGKALFVDTVFNAWNTLRRNLVKEAMEPLMADHPAEVEAALRVVNGNLINYCLATLERGAAGIFLSVPASAEFVTPEQYARFMRPYDLELLNAVKGKGEFHILHAHGEKLYLDQLLAYPVQALSWADLNGGPSIAEARKRTPLALMAGINHVKFPYVSSRVIRDQVKDACAQAGNTKFILAPGCSVATYSFSPLIQAAHEAARGLGR